MKKQKNLRLGAADRERLRAIAAVYGISQGDVIEILVRAKARDDGISADAPTSPMQGAPMAGPHPSHVTRMSDASSFDEICVNCGAHDEVPGGWGQLAYPCPNAPKDEKKEPPASAG